MAVHVRNNSLYISVPSSAKQQREMTDFSVAWRTLTATATFFKLLFQICPLCSGFGFAIVLTVKDKMNDFRVSQDS